MVTYAAKTVPFYYGLNGDIRCKDGSFYYGLNGDIRCKDGSFLLWPEWRHTLQGRFLFIMASMVTYAARTVPFYYGLNGDIRCKDGSFYYGLNGGIRCKDGSFLLWPEW